MNLLRILITSLMLFSSASAIIIIEPVDINSKPQGIGGTVDLSSNVNKGNTDTEEYSVSALLEKSLTHEYKFILGSYTYGQAKNVRNKNSFYLHGRYLHDTQTPDLIWEIFSQIEKNEFQQLQYRLIAGGGLRWKLSHSFYGGVGAFQANEEEKNANSLNYARGNIYLSYKKRFDSLATMKLIYIAYYQPRLDNGADYNLLQNAALTVTLTESIDLKFTLTHKYDSRPPKGVDATDIAQSTSLSYHF